MSLHHRTLSLFQFIALSALTFAGCNQRDAKNDAPVAEPNRNAAEPAKKPAHAAEKPAAESGLDTPSHPPVAAQASDGAPQENPTTNDGVPGNAAEMPGADNAANTTPATDSGERVVTPTPPPGALPTIALTAAHKATCKVFVGDTLPPLNVTDLDGNATPVDKNFGPRLTLVVFWQNNDADAMEAIVDLEQLVLTPYGKRGVRAVAIHEGADSEEIKSLAQQKHLNVPMFVDADGSALAQVSTDVQGLMPRLFLIDSAGRILWFDIEYSRTTRRDLDAALRYLSRQ